MTSDSLTGRHSLTLIAQRLYEAMERIDPSGGKPWEELSDGQRQFYELAVEEALENAGKLSGVLDSDDDVVARSADRRK